MNDAEPEFQLIGILENDAPGLHFALKRSLGTLTLQRMEVVYAWVASHGGLCEDPISRHPGVSYNPKPARICHILMKELHEREETTLAAAMFICAPRLSMKADLNSFEEAMAIALEAQQAEKFSFAQISLAAERVFLAHSLDALRHVHMSTWNTLDRSNFLEYINASIIPHVKYPENFRLQLLLRAGVARVRNYSN